MVDIFKHLTYSKLLDSFRSRNNCYNRIKKKTIGLLTSASYPMLPVQSPGLTSLKTVGLLLIKDYFCFENEMEIESETCDRKIETEKLLI